MLLQLSQFGIKSLLVTRQVLPESLAHGRLQMIHHALVATDSLASHSTIVELYFQLAEVELGSPGGRLAGHRFERRGNPGSGADLLAGSIDLEVQSQVHLRHHDLNQVLLREFVVSGHRNRLQRVHTGHSHVGKAILGDREVLNGISLESSLNMFVQERLATSVQHLLQGRQLHVHFHVSVILPFFLAWAAFLASGYSHQ